MKTLNVNQGLQFISGMGVSGFLSGVETGMLSPEFTRMTFDAIGGAIDTYVEAVPNDRSLHDVRENLMELISSRVVFSDVQKRLIDMFAERRADLERAVNIALKINFIGHIASESAMASMSLDRPLNLGEEWCWIRPGKFMMGSADDDPNARSDEKPLLALRIGGFYMLDHPVTNAEFRAFLAAVDREDLRNLPSDFSGDDQPAVFVNYKDADAYSKWIGEKISSKTGANLSGRLPSEAEWEKAAKGPNNNEFIEPATHEQAHFGAKNTRAVNHPDAMPNGYGLKDMVGNVSEWTISPWEGRPSTYVLRGESWSLTFNNNLRAACRQYASHPVLDCTLKIGFRPVLTHINSKE